jgi:drug/metabolite transporter (DMT)-like permease
MPTSSSQHNPQTPEPSWILAMPTVFVLLWSTGFIGAKWGLPYAEPFTFLSIRFGIAALLFASIVVVTKAPWPKSFSEVRDSVIVGLLMHGAYLGGVFWAIRQGTPAGITAIVVGAQPLLTATLAYPLLRERLNRTQWCGLVMGFGGLVLVVWKGAGIGPWSGILASVVALLGITIGTFYQKRFGSGTNLRAASCIQQAAACVLLTVLAFSLETRSVQWTGDFIFALTWLVVVLSIGTFTLYYFLIGRGAVSKVSSLFYLVPPVVALDAWLLFDETLEMHQIGGMILAASGVALVTRVSAAGK